MQGETWQESLRALYLIDAVTDPERSHSQSETMIKEYFVNSPEAIKRATGSAQERVRLRAYRVLSNLGITELSVSSATAMSTGIDLLAVEGDTISSGAPQEEVPADLLTLMSETQETDIVAQKFDSIDIGSSGADLLGQTLDAVPPAHGNGDFLATEDHNVFDAGIGADPFISVGEPNASLSDTVYGDWTSTTPSNSNTTKDPYSLVDFSSQPQTSPIPPVAQPISDFSFAMGHDQSNLTQLNNQISEQEIPSASTGSKDALSIWNAATSGISSTKREDAAFSFIEGAMNDLKKK